MSKVENFSPVSTLDDTFEDEVIGYAMAMEASVVATPVHESNDQLNLDGSAQKNRQNHLFCGCCCDSRRATIVVNMIAIIWYTVLVVAFAFLGVSIAENGLPGDQDDSRQEGANFDDEGHEVLFEGEVMAAVIISAVSIALHIFGIYGAIYYHSTSVGASALGYMLSLGLALVSLNMTGIILCSLFFYAHAILLLEIRNGIMTPYNYENIKACCECCDL